MKYVGAAPTLNDAKRPVLMCLEQVGDLVVYFEIDSFIPKTSRFWELDPATLTTFNGKEGYRVQSKRLGNHLWQGLAFPLVNFPEINHPYEDRVRLVGRDVATDELLSRSFANLLGVEKWEFTETALCLAALGPSPAFLYMPGWRRIQDMDKSIFSGSKRKQMWQITEKLDGVTMVVYKLAKDSHWAHCLPTLPAHCPASMQDDRNRYGVCSRREDLIDSDYNLYWQMARNSKVLDRIHDIQLPNVAVHGELCGSSIEGNTMKYPEGEHEFIVFGIWDIDTRKYLKPKPTVKLCKELGIKHAPVVGYSCLENYASDVHELLLKAEGNGEVGGVREGFVFKSLDGTEHFKVISNRWLSLTGK